MTSAEQEKGAVGKYFGAYLCILALATLQFFIAYSNLEPSQMLVRMLFVAIVEAAVGVLSSCIFGSKSADSLCSYYSLPY